MPEQMWRRAQKQNVSSSFLPNAAAPAANCCPFLARMAHGANAARHVPRCWLVAAKCSNSATLPGRAGGETLGLVTTKCNVILLQNDPSPSCGRSPSITGPFAVAVAAVRAKTLGACQRRDRADLGRGGMGHELMTPP